jgi:hypothetical protein
VIIGDLSSVIVGGEVIDDDLLIEAKGAFIDGIGQILGQASATSLRPASTDVNTFFPRKNTAILVMMLKEENTKRYVVNQ